MKHQGNRSTIAMLGAVGCMALTAPLPAQSAFAQSRSGAPAGIRIAILPVGPMYLATKSQGYLGVDLRDVSEDQLAALKLKEAHGAEITTVDHDGPAGKAGLREHDVVLQMNGQPIEGEEQLRRMLRETPAGRTVAFVISRDGQSMSLSVQLANRADVERQAWEQHFSVPDPETAPPTRIDSQAPAIAAPGFVADGTGAAPSHSSGFLPMFSFHSVYTGAMVDNLGPQLAAYFGARPGTGLLVKSVDANSPASTAGLKAGDVVVKVNSAEVASPNDWLKSMRENKGRPVQVTVLRNKQEQNLSLTPGTPKKK